MGKRKVFLGAIALAACMCMVTSVVADDFASLADAAKMTQIPQGEIDAFIAAGGANGGPRDCVTVYENSTMGGSYVSGLAGDPETIWLDDVELAGVNRELCEITWTVYATAPATAPYDVVCYVWDDCPVDTSVSPPVPSDATLIATSTATVTAMGVQTVTFVFAGEVMPDVRADDPPVCDGTLDAFIGYKVVGAVQGEDAGPIMRSCTPELPEMGCSDDRFGTMSAPIPADGDGCNYFFGGCPDNPVGTFMATITADTHPGACCHTDDGTCDEVATASLCLGVYDVFYSEMNCPGGANPIVCEAITGACCNDDTGFCDTGINISDCLGADRDGSTGGAVAPWLVGPTRFIPDSVDCNDFLPLCGEGACCYEDGAAAGQPGTCAYMTEALCIATGSMIAFIPGGICEGDSGLVDPNQEPQPEEFTRCYVAPANDECDNAIALAAGVVHTHSNSGATMPDAGTYPDYPEFTCDGAPPNVEFDCDVWFTYTVVAGCDGALLISVDGEASGMDPVVDVWNDQSASGGTCYNIYDGTGMCMGANDDLTDWAGTGDDPCNPTAAEGTWIGVLAYIGSNGSDYQVSLSGSTVGDVLYIRVGGVANQGNEFGAFDIYVECREDDFGRCVQNDGTCYNATMATCDADVDAFWWAEFGLYCQQITCGTEPIVAGVYCKWGIEITPPAIDASETVLGTVPAGTSLFYKFTIPEEYPFIVDTCGSDFDTVINIWNPTTDCGFISDGGSGTEYSSEPPSIIGATPMISNDDCLALGGLPCSPPDPTPNGESCLCYDPDLMPVGWTQDIIIEIVNGGTTDGALTLTISQLGDVVCPDCMLFCDGGCKGDLTLDNIINGLDIQAFLNVLVADPQDCTQEAWCLANMDGDLDVDMTDLGWFVYALLIPYDCDGDLTVACGDEGYCQLDPAFGAYGGTYATISDLDTGAVLVNAENFLSWSGGNITKVCWWGAYWDRDNTGGDCAAAGGTDNFRVTYYNSGVLGGMGLAKSVPFTNVVTRTATGVTVAGLDIYAYEMDHNAVLAGPGECVWVEIVNHTPDGDGCYWTWWTAPAGDETSMGDGGVLNNFDLALCVNIPIYAPSCPVICEIDCPDGAIDENEPDCEDAWEDVTNGGCYMATPAFTPLACGDTYCGTSGIYDIDDEYIGRDTDWYEFTVTEETGLDLTFDTEFQLVYFVFEAPCPAVVPDDLVVVAGGYAIFPCPGEMVGVGTEYVDAGTYYVYVTADFDYEYEYPGMQPCGSDYVMTFECEVCPEYTNCLTCSDTEGETCGTSVNDGCNGDPVVFGAITCGGSICGNAWAESGMRDTDWFEFTITEEQLVTATLTSEFEGTVMILSVPTCESITVEAANYSADCVAGVASAVLPAGTYVLWIGPGNADGGIFNCLPCGGFNDYEVTLTCVEPPEACSIELTGTCQPADGGTASNGDVAGATVYQLADNFRPTVTGDITHLCWWGVDAFHNGTDWVACDLSAGLNFSVVFYNDDGSGAPYGGLPGTVLATPAVSNLTRSDTGETFNGWPIWLYEADVTAVGVVADSCYWMEIHNNSGIDCWFLWLQSTVGDNFHAVSSDGVPTYAADAGDMSWCIDIAATTDGCGYEILAGDECADAIVVACGDTWTVADTCGFTVNASDPMPSCQYGGRPLAHTLWYKFTWDGANGTTATFNTCNTAAGGSQDNNLAIYTGTCGALSEYDCDEDSCGNNGWMARLDLTGLTDGTTYYVMMNHPYADDCGEMTFNFTCP